VFLLCSAPRTGQHMQPAADSTVLATLRSEVARLERRSEAGRQERVVTLGGRRSTQRCRRAAWHWAPCTRSQALGPQVEYGTAATLMVAGLLSRVAGQVLWVLEQADIHPPALAAVGLAPDRVVYVRARKPQTALLIMEEGVRHSGLAGIVGEFSGALGLTASRRLQLAAEQSGVMAFLLRPSRCFDNPALLEPSAAATRWRVAVTPCAGDAGAGPPALAPGSDPVPRRRRAVLDRGGIRYDGESDRCLFTAHGKACLAPEALVDAQIVPQAVSGIDDVGPARR